MQDENNEPILPVDPAGDPGAETLQVSTNSSSDPDLTQKTTVASSETEPEILEENTPAPKAKRWPWVLGGIVFVLLMTAGGAYLGSRAAMKAREMQMADQSKTLATEQFMLGQQDMAEGRLDIARQRFEYVVQLDPDFPGVAEQLAQAMLQQAILMTPTVTPTVEMPTPSPTPDLRGIEEIFNTARQHYMAQEWPALIESLEALRNTDPTYRTVEVDGMYYVALRFRGVDKILKEGNLEGGMYDLALVERFGPLDRDADGYRTWARLYLTGSSFWEVNWEQTVYLLSQVAPYFPGLIDGSGYTAGERYRLALIGYGEDLMAREDYCGAQQQFEAAQNMAPDAALEPKLNEVREKCANPPGQQQEAPTQAPSVDPTPTTETVVETQPPVEETQPPVTEVTPEPPVTP